MKVGIFSYHFSNNYGALYQCFCLRQWFLDHNITADFVPYHPDYVEYGGSFDRPWNLSLWRKNATILYMKLAEFKRRLLMNNHSLSGFNSFRQNQLGIKEFEISHPAELCNHMSQYDMLVCGSDQIWNPSIQRGLDPVYFLDIPGSHHARKISYAPSFGRTEIEAKYTSQVVDLVRGLDAISVREDSGRDILVAAGVPSKDVAIVPDPTILLGHFGGLLEHKRSYSDNVFCYALRSDSVIREVAEMASSSLGVPLVSARGNRQRWRDIGTGETPDPIEWLQRISSAKLVVSNSFHGIAISIVLNRPFIAVALTGKKSTLNARVMDLLKLVGLSDRLITEHDLSLTPQLVQSDIDWDSVNQKLKVVRIAGEAYLKNQINLCQEVASCKR